MNIMFIMTRVPMDKEKAKKLADKIKGYVTMEGNNITKIAKLLYKSDGNNYSQQSLSSKLKLGTIKYLEVEEIADLIGYDIVWVKRK